MPELLAVTINGQPTDAKKLAAPIKRNITAAREHRKQFEAVWQSNMAFAAGQHWLVYDSNFRALRKIQDVDPRYRRRELYQADVITEIRTHVLGELGSDDDRPELLLQRDDQMSEDFQAQVNKALGWAWDNEFDGDTALSEADRYCIDLGTSAVQCYFDPSYGKVKAENVPHQNGQPILDPEQAVQTVSAAAMNGQTLQYRSIKEGRICWRPLSALNLLPPPGVTHEKYFPWECIVRPVPLEQVKGIFPETTENLTEDNDISSTLGEVAVGPSASSYATGGARKNALRGHVWLFTYFLRPSANYPKGLTFHFASNDYKFVGFEEKLPYIDPQGDYRSGITYFHWWRVTGRFWSRSLTESLKDGQRSINKRRTQMNEIIDRGLPYTLVQTGSQAKKRTDLPMEIIEIDRSEQQPVHVQGIAPGGWFYQELEQIQNDLQRASGINVSSLGDNPPNVGTYSQLALMREADQVKRQQIFYERKLSIAQLVKDTVYDIRTYWGPQKQLMLAGDEDEVNATVFNATKIPSFFIVKVSKGTAKPRSQAAELQKVQDVAQYSAQIGMPLPTRWLKDSLDHGQATELPEDPQNEQADKAELENDLMMRGVDVPVAYYDPSQVHIPIHRGAQLQAEYAGDMGAWQRLEKHIQEHEQNDAQNAQQVAQIQASAPAPPEGATPGAVAPSPAPGPPQSQGVS